MFVFYLLIVWLLEIIAFPFLYIYLQHKKQLARLALRLPQIKKKAIWFHAASVGEVNALRPFLLAALEEFQDFRLILTTVTDTGRNTALEISPEIFITYLPLDLPFTMSRFIRKTAPSLMVIMETELWPQMIYQAARKKIPSLLINARLTEKSFGSYRSTIWFWNYLFPTINRVNAQSDEDAVRFKELGFRRVFSSGNLKMALHLPQYEKAELREKWNFSEDDFIIVFGSSRPGEEKMLLEDFLHLNTVIKDLRIIIAPRHLQRLAEVIRTAHALSPQLYSESQDLSGANLIIIDKMGILKELYALADLAIIGGSFYDFGGHNPLEAAYYHLPIIMGEYFSSCKNSVKMLQKYAAIIISQPDLLADHIIKLYNDKELRLELGENAGKMLKDNSEVIENNIYNLKNMLS